jgi:hypothetical protein
VDLDIVGNWAVHSAGLREVAARMVGKGSKQADPAGSGTIRNFWIALRRCSKRVWAFTLPGTYEITTSYRSKSGEPVTSKPVRFVVFDPDDPAAERKAAE